MRERKRRKVKRERDKEIFEIDKRNEKEIQTEMKRERLTYEKTKT